MNIPGIIASAMSGGADKLIEKMGNVVDNLITSKEEKETLKIELKKEINRHNETTKAEATKRIEAELKDIQGARDANARIQESDKASWWAKNTAYFLDVFLGLIWGFVTIFLVMKALNLIESVKVDLTAILSIYSTITAMFMISLNFHRGTSRSSQEKQKQLNDILKNS